MGEKLCKYYDEYDGKCGTFLTSRRTRVRCVTMSKLNPMGMPMPVHEDSILKQMFAIFHR